MRHLLGAPLSSTCRCLCSSARVPPPESIRPIFKLPKDVLKRWYPRHMSTSYRFMMEKQSTMDALIEVHDARIPITGRNSTFEADLLPGLPHLLIFNKSDLITDVDRHRVTAELPSDASAVLWTNSKETANQTADAIIAQLLPILPQQSNETRDGYDVMICGIPNVGKSTIINAIRNRFELQAHDGRSRKATKTGAMPGITRQMLYRIKVHSSPEIYVHDTPGILSPYTESDVMAMKLALCRTVNDTTIGQDYVADFLLWRLNTRGEQWRYVKYFDLPHATDDVTQLILQICKSQKLTIMRNMPGRGKVPMPDMMRATQVWLTAFNNGHLGGQFLDDDLLRPVKKFGVFPK